MATFEFLGLDEYLGQLNELKEHATGLIKRAVYDGAAQVANAVAAEIQNLPEVDGYQYPWKVPISGVTREQKAGLLEGLGLAKMEDSSGFINTHVGFDGYNSVESKQYPNGQPNAMLARSINSGSSTRRKIPFMSRALKNAKDKAQSAMAARLDADIETIINN